MKWLKRLVGRMSHRPPEDAKFSVGDLVCRYASSGRRGNRRYYQDYIGVAVQIRGVPPNDESHVKIRRADNSERILDVNSTRYVGKPKARRGSVIVKWLENQPEGVPSHQEWQTEMVTEIGWALARDPWGDLHWLPARETDGDVGYVFTHLDKRYEVAMQTSVAQ